MSIVQVQQVTTNESELQEKITFPSSSSDLFKYLQCPKISFAVSSELVQLLIPLLIAGVGNVLTGYLLNNTTHHLHVFQIMPQLIIVIPALLGLKGNVEMTLASRLSTQANLGILNDTKQLRALFTGNFFLVQCQATTIGFIASLASVSMSFLFENESDENQMLLSNSNNSLIANERSLFAHSPGSSLDLITIMIGASVFTVYLASVLLSCLIFLIVHVCKQYDLDPDNVAIPVAASIGDFVTLCLYVLFCQGIFTRLCSSDLQQNIFWFLIIWSLLAFALLIVLPIMGYLATQSRYTARVIYNGWYSILAGMGLQTVGGLIMENALQFFPLVPLFQPIINGIGGNLVAIHCTRMSTYLYKNATKRSLPEGQRTWLSNPFHLFVSSYNPHARLTKILMLLSVITHLFFLSVIHLVPNDCAITLHFVFVFISAELIQLFILLFLAHVVVHLQWRKGINPDNNSIPFMTAFADLIGSALLALAFMYLRLVNDSTSN